MRYEVVLDRDPYQPQQVVDTIRKVCGVIAHLGDDITILWDTHEIPNECGTPGYSKSLLKLVFDDKDAALLVKLALGGSL
jgi:hypothetical protein